MIARRVGDVTLDALGAMSIGGKIINSVRYVIRRASCLNTYSLAQ